MKPSGVLLMCVFSLFVLGLNGLGWYTVVDEWRTYRKISAAIGATLLIMSDLLITAIFLYLQGM